LLQLNIKLVGRLPCKTASLEIGGYLLQDCHEINVNGS